MTHLQINESSHSFRWTWHSFKTLTYSQQKQLIPVANKPVLFYAIEDVIEAGVDEIDPNREQVIETVKSVEWDAEITFIHQGDPKGLAHAILVHDITSLRLQTLFSG